MKTTLTALMTLSLVASAAGCGPKTTPRERYIQGLNHKLAGNAEAYFANLVALAHDVPDSRAGRRARATLASGGMMTQVAVIGILAAIAIPNFLKFQARAKQSEAKANLKALFTALKSYYAEHKRYCATFKECGFKPDLDSRYLYFLGPEEVVGGDMAESAEMLKMRAGPTLRLMDIEPKVLRRRFLAVAVGDIDGDFDLDIWTIDHDNNLQNPLNDVD